MHTYIQRQNQQVNRRHIKIRYLLTYGPGAGIGQPRSERSSRLGPEPSSVEADVYVWCYALLVVHARKEEEEEDTK